MTPEGKIKAMVKKSIDSLIATGVVWDFMPVQNGMGKQGLDFFFCVNGRFVAIETKTKGKKLTPVQTMTKASIERAGGKVFLVDDAQSCANAMIVIRGLAGWGMANFTPAED